MSLSLSSLLLAVFLVLYALSAFGWVAVATWLLGLAALAAAIAIVVEGMTAKTITIGRP